ncbi:MAG: class I SAM-dependent methyltransferase [Candidatus Scalindua sp.]
MKRILLIVILRFHNLCYRYAASLAIRIEGKHPKHRLMRYKEWFLDHIQPDDVVLDIGCNTGGMPGLFSSKAAFVYGVEIDERLIDEAKGNNAALNVEYIHADATLLDYSTLRPISVVTLSNVLEHIEERVGFLSDVVARVHWRDSTNRRFLIRVPMTDRDWITLYKKESGVEWRLDPTHFTEYTLQQFREELAAADIEIDNIEIRFGEIYAVCKV